LKNLGNRASQPHFTLADLRSTAVLLQLILMDFFFTSFIRSVLAGMTAQYTALP